MRPVVTAVIRSVVCNCMSVCVLVTLMYSAKMFDMIEMPFGVLTHMSQGTMW